MCCDCKVLTLTVWSVDVNLNNSPVNICYFSNTLDQVLVDVVAICKPLVTFMSVCHLGLNETREHVVQFYAVE